MTGLARAVLRIVGAGIFACAIANAAQAAGALAVGACAAYGSAYDYAKAEQARAAALGKCSGACKVVATMRRNCAAFAIDGRNPCGAFGYSAAPRLGLAQNVAMRQCYRHGGRDCVIRAWACDGNG